MGSVLRHKVRETAGRLGGCFPGKTDDGFLVTVCEVPDGQTREGDAYGACNNFELVFPQGGYRPEGLRYADCAGYPG